MKRQFLHIILPVAALALSACGTMSNDKGQAEFTYPQSDGFSGNFLAGKAAQMENSTDYAARYLLRAHELDADNKELRRRAFLALVSDGRIADAEGIARQLYAENHEDLFAVMAVMDADIQNDDYQSALDVVSGLPKRGINALIAPLAKAWLYAGLNDQQQALASLNEMEGNGALNPLSEYHRGLILAYFNDLDGAERALASAYGDPADAPLRAAEALGAVYERKGQTQKAALLYSSYMDRHPQSLAMPYHLRRLERGDPPLATVVTPASGLAEAYLDIATLLSQENAVDPSLLLARYSLSLRPGDDITRLLVGEVMEIQKRFEAAISVYSAIPKSSPHSWNARLRIASSLEQIGKADEAIALLKDMVNERDSRPDALIQLGDIMRFQQDFAGAANAYDQAIKRLGGESQVGWRLLYRRGIAHERAGNWKKAEYDFLLALELEPEQPYVLNYLGYSWVEMGKNFDKAEEMLKRAVALQPEDGYIVDSLGWVYYKLGRFEDAVTQLEKAVELKPDDPTLNDHLGDAYWQAGRYHEARFQWNRALSFDPTDELRATVEAKLNGQVPSTDPLVEN
ncbi:tetratricopeptide repeat protein [Thalassospira lucentensis]|uniref:tetratricopeptide repeat protein n=1 Tax=Thalassospira lucentensis TaxID=168935 RepID=UPI00142D6B71|nr:tetratricopeptide repeat protein [Thalassospira lucentensis]NIZ00270.1 tetratricopeptide repeat protein [Thalassospira lucentensis]